MAASSSSSSSTHNISISTNTVDPIAKISRYSNVPPSLPFERCRLAPVSVLTTTRYSFPMVGDIVRLISSFCSREDRLTMSLICVQWKVWILERFALIQIPGHQKRTTALSFVSHDNHEHPLYVKNEIASEIWRWTKEAAMSFDTSDDVVHWLKQYQMKYERAQQMLLEVQRKNEELPISLSTAQQKLQQTALTHFHWHNDHKACSPQDRYLRENMSWIMDNLPPTLQSFSLVTPEILSGDNESNYDFMTCDLVAILISRLSMLKTLRLAIISSGINFFDRLRGLLQSIGKTSLTHVSLTVRYLYRTLSEVATGIVICRSLWEHDTLAENVQVLQLRFSTCNQNPAMEFFRPTTRLICCHTLELEVNHALPVLDQIAPSFPALTRLRLVYVIPLEPAIRGATNPVEVWNRVHEGCPLLVNVSLHQAHLADVAGLMTVPNWTLQQLTLTYGSSDIFRTFELVFNGALPTVNVELLHMGHMILTQDIKLKVDHPTVIELRLQQCYSPCFTDWASSFSQLQTLHFSALELDPDIFIQPNLWNFPSLFESCKQLKELKLRLRCLANCDVRMRHDKRNKRIQRRQCVTLLVNENLQTPSVQKLLEDIIHYPLLIPAVVASDMVTKAREFWRCRAVVWEEQQNVMMPMRHLIWPRSEQQQQKEMVHTFGSDTSGVLRSLKMQHEGASGLPMSAAQKKYNT